MPKGRGNKGNACSRKRKSSLPIQSTVDNPAFLSSSSTCTTTSPKSSPAQSIDLAPQTNPEPNICGAQTNVCFPSPNVFAPGFSSQHLYGGLASMPWSYGYPRTQALNSPVPASPIPPNMPFVLCKIEGNISICAGCHNKYKKIHYLQMICVSDIRNGVNLHHLAQTAHKQDLEMHITILIHNAFNFATGFSQILWRFLPPSIVISQKCTKLACARCLT